jgi:hypothetical protein
MWFRLIGLRFAAGVSFPCYWDPQPEFPFLVGTFVLILISQVLAFGT